MCYRWSSTDSLSTKKIKMRRDTVLPYIVVITSTIVYICGSFDVVAEAFSLPPPYLSWYPASVVLCNHHVAVHTAALRSASSTTVGTTVGSTRCDDDDDDHHRHHRHHHHHPEFSYAHIDATTRTVKDESNPDSVRRSLFTTTTLIASMMTTTMMFMTCPQKASAGEVGAKITKAVTTSDLGISVRTSVVKGAQIIDKVDGQWEKFSDRFGLGSERSRQGRRPKAKVIPDPLPLNIDFCKQILIRTDNAFCSVVGVDPSYLQGRITKVANLVRVSFERSGITFRDDDILSFDDGRQFNFVTYAHFRAYSEIVIERNVNFSKFRSEFEATVGKDIAKSVLSESTIKMLSSSGGNDKRESLKEVLSVVDQFLNIWKANGLISLWESPSIDDDKIEDWIEDISDLELSYALDGDVTLNAQILLQEQGYRLYPNFARFVMTFLFSSPSPSSSSQQPQWVDGRKPWKVGGAMDYYFDTDYNSDPDKFEVKEVLISIQLEDQ